MAITARGQAPSKFMYFLSNPNVRKEKKHSFPTRRLEMKRNILVKDFDLFPTGYRRGRRGWWLVVVVGWRCLSLNISVQACTQVHVSMYACTPVSRSTTRACARAAVLKPQCTRYKVHVHIKPDTHFSSQSVHYRRFVRYLCSENSKITSYKIQNTEYKLRNACYTYNESITPQVHDLPEPDLRGEPLDGMARMLSNVRSGAEVPCSVYL